MMDPRPSIQCPRCKMISHNPWDVAYGYCGNCHEFVCDMDKTRRGGCWPMLFLGSIVFWVALYCWWTS